MHEPPQVCFHQAQDELLKDLSSDCGFGTARTAWDGLGIAAN